jgi:PilZ domain
VIEEKRQSPRFPCTVKIRGSLLSRLHVNESSLITLEGVAENIGKGGIGVLSNRSFPMNSVLRCELAAGSDIGVPTLVEVRWLAKLPEKQLFKLGLQFLV